MDREFIARHWYAAAYEQFETQTHDVEFLLKVLAERAEPQRVLEVACGGGRICVPLAKAGHKVTGFDKDQQALLRCYRKMQGIPNIACYRADALLEDWGEGFDVVVMAGNLLINIETEMDYAQAQRLFLQKAAAALRPGGHLFLDYDQHSDASAVEFFNHLRPEGGGHSGEVRAVWRADELGTRGRFLNYGGVYDPVTRICIWASHRELLTNNGETIIESTIGHKHIPALAEVFGWLADAGLVVEKTWKDYTDAPLDEQEKGFARATIWALKPGA